jgi:hypothetical protein
MLPTLKHSTKPTHTHTHTHKHTPVVVIVNILYFDIRVLSNFQLLSVIVFVAFDVAPQKINLIVLGCQTACAGWL